VDDGQRRRAANEAVFREVNERIEDLNRSSGALTDEPMRIVCECDRLDCFEQIAVGVDAYEWVRADARLYFVAAGHEDLAVETIVDEQDGYYVVEKHRGEPAEVSEETDPRR